MELGSKKILNGKWGSGSANYTPLSLSLSPILSRSPQAQASLYTYRQNAFASTTSTNRGELSFSLERLTFSTSIRQFNHVNLIWAKVKINANALHERTRRWLLRAKSSPRRIPGAYDSSNNIGFCGNCRRNGIQKKHSKIVLCDFDICADWLLKCCVCRWMCNSRNVRFDYRWALENHMTPIAEMKCLPCWPGQICVGW